MNIMSYDKMSAAHRRGCLCHLQSAGYTSRVYHCTALYYYNSIYCGGACDDDTRPALYNISVQNNMVLYRYYILQYNNYTTA